MAWSQYLLTFQTFFFFFLKEGSTKNVEWRDGWNIKEANCTGWKRWRWRWCVCVCVCGETERPEHLISFLPHFFDDLRLFFRHADDITIDCYYGTCSALHWHQRSPLAFCLPMLQPFSPFHTNPSLPAPFKYYARWRGLESLSPAPPPPAFIHILKYVQLLLALFYEKTNEKSMRKQTRPLHCSWIVWLSSSTLPAPFSLKKKTMLS